MGPSLDLSLKPHHSNINFRPLIRRSVRYLLVSNGFRLVQAVVVLAVLSFILTGSRIVAIDRLGSRADIVASIFITIATIGLLTKLNRRVMNALDRRFFREAYNAQLILTELGEIIPTLTKTKQLFKLVADKLNAALHPETVTILLDDEVAGAYVPAFSSGGSGRGSSALRYDDELIKTLRSPEPLRSFEYSDHNSETVRALGSALLIAIASKGELRGFISLGQRLSDQPYTPEDKSLLLMVANQMATFIEDMKTISRMVEEERIERELQMAAEVQRHLFPADSLQDEVLDIYGTCRPARGVGGDYYDYFAIDDHRTGVAIADVAGKGLPAALLMSTVQASLRC